MLRNKKQFFLTPLSLIMVLMLGSMSLLQARVRSAKNSERFDRQIDKGDSPMAIAMFYHTSKEMDPYYKRRLQDVRNTFAQLSNKHRYKKSNVKFVQANVTKLDSLINRYSLPNDPHSVTFVLFKDGRLLSTQPEKVIQQAYTPPTPTESQSTKLETKLETEITPEQEIMTQEITDNTQENIIPDGQTTQKPQKIKKQTEPLITRFSISLDAPDNIHLGDQTYKSIRSLLEKRFGSLIDTILEEKRERAYERSLYWGSYYPYGYYYPYSYAYYPRWGYGYPYGYWGWNRPYYGYRGGYYRGGARGSFSASHRGGYRSGSVGGGHRGGGGGGHRGGGGRR